MAYGFTTTVKALDVDGAQCYFVTVVETDAATTDEYTVTGLPTHGRIVLFIAKKGAGAAATIQPAFTSVAGAASTDLGFITAQPAAAAYFNDQSTVRYMNLVNGTLYGRSKPDAGADNVVTTWMLIIPGAA